MSDRWDHTLVILCVFCVAVAGIAGIWLAFPAGERADRDVLFQVSTIGALMEGNYRGLFPFGEIRKRGDLGIGTFDSLDGEMIAVNGEYFQVTADGSVLPVSDRALTPFATVTFFEPDISFFLARADNFSDFSRRVERSLPSKDQIYAIRIPGKFPYVRARSVPRQEEPYPRLVDAVRNQSVFVFEGTRGTIAGFWFPAAFDGLNVPGFHLHYITDDRKAGGHVLDFSLENATVEIDVTPRFLVALTPVGGNAAGLPGPNSTELASVEQGG
ncbi:MAG: acetolactate decarboxylase [Methanolinea sp.]|nr:acetolactate decarboxylase [Methanolinea sp.]